MKRQRDHWPVIGCNTQLQFLDEVIGCYYKLVDADAILNSANSKATLSVWDGLDIDTFRLGQSKHIDFRSGTSTLEALRTVT